VFAEIRKEFLEIIDPIIQDVYAEAVDMGFDGDIRDLDEAWIEEFFEEYNPVTKYVFANEIERKKMRLFESLVADMPGKMQSYKIAEKLLTKQIQQYAIELEDAITKAVYTDIKVEYVMWNAEDDDKTCGVCNELDEQVFELKDAPPKQHYGCRCYLTPVKE
jgi:SPP1 gp7 family putative phage head morphogenesis protein